MVIFFTRELIQVWFLLLLFLSDPQDFEIILWLKIRFFLHEPLFLSGLSNEAAYPVLAGAQHPSLSIWDLRTFPPHSNIQLPPGAAHHELFLCNQINPSIWSLLDTGFPVGQAGFFHHYQLSWWKPFTIFYKPCCGLQDSMENWISLPYPHRHKNVLSQPCSLSGRCSLFFCVILL